MGANIKKIGNKAEGKVKDFFYERGWWCHIFAYNKNGQPCDLIAMKDEKVILADVKHNSGKRFGLSRIEPNQWDSLRRAFRCGMRNIGFIISDDKNENYKWLPYLTALGAMAEGKASIEIDSLQELEETL